MKKIACFINDSNFLERLVSFCELEKFTLINIKDSVCEFDASIIVFITDCLNTVKSFDGGVPICLIGKRGNLSASIFVITDDFDSVQLRYLVDAVCHNGDMENSMSSVRPISTKREFSISNDIFNVERIVYLVTKEFIYFLDFSSLERIRIGLAEMITNAIEHGNLSISGDQKLEATENGTYYELIEARLKEQKYKDKKVTFGYSINAEGLNVYVEDQGKGFSVSEIPDPTKQEGLYKLHGRGILITRMYFDEVSYNNTGNRVELFKRF